MSVSEYEQNIDLYESMRMRLVQSIPADELAKLPLKEKILVNSILTDGTNSNLKRIKNISEEKNNQTEETFKRAATEYIKARKELAVRQAQRIKEGELSNARESLPELESTSSSGAEGLKGQYQLPYDVLSGKRAFDQEKDASPKRPKEEPES